MEIKEIINDARRRMDSAVDDARRKLAAVRTGRASVSLLDNVTVEYYGTEMPLNQVATIHAPEPTMLTVQPFDPTQIGPIEKAIRASELGLNPSNDGKLIRIPIPPLTEERRKDLVKQLHGIAENHRVAIRNIRRDGNESVKKLFKDKAITEDDDRRAHEEIQKMTDLYMGKLDSVAKIKEKEILEIK